MKRVVEQARRAQLAGEKVPAVERVFSIFEPHTELLMRGRQQKPVEFGHMVLLCQSPEKFITDYEAYLHRRADCQLTEEVIERHEGLFDQTPEVLAADMGFCPDQEKYEELQGRVGTLAIPRRMRDLADAVMSMLCGPPHNMDSVAQAVMWRPARFLRDFWTRCCAGGGPGASGDGAGQAPGPAGVHRIGGGRSAGREASRAPRLPAPRRTAGGEGGQ
jgi:hypothetical protein